MFSFVDYLIPPLRRIDWLTLGVGPTIAQAIRPTRHQAGNGCREPEEPKQSQPEPPSVLVDGAEILADLERAARRGFVPAEALIRRLYAAYLDELAEKQRQLDALEKALDVHVRRLDTLFPAPLPPAPEPMPAPRARRFGPMGDMWGK